VTEASVIVGDQPLGTISRRLYGYLAEHLGRCCYAVGAEALQVEVAADSAGPFGGPSLGATASGRPDRAAVTLISWEYRRSVTVNIRAAGIVSSSRLLTAASPEAGNDPANSERVSPRRLLVDDSRAGRCTVPLPPHSMATIEFAANGANRD
jgi:alpha-L-arabinofuranosidase